MNEERVIEFKLKVKDGKGKEYEIEKQESFIIEGYDSTKCMERTMNFQLKDGKDHKFVVTLYPSKGLFGDKISMGASQGEFMPEQKPVYVINCSAKFKKNPWRTEGKILVSFLVVSVIGLIIALFWSRRKKKV